MSAADEPGELGLCGWRIAYTTHTTDDSQYILYLADEPGELGLCG
jgi:hypothetical protein